MKKFMLSCALMVCSGFSYDLTPLRLKLLVTQDFVLRSGDFVQKGSSLVRCEAGKLECPFEFSKGDTMYVENYDPQKSRITMRTDKGTDNSNWFVFHCKISQDQSEFLKSDRKACLEGTGVFKIIGTW